MPFSFIDIEERKKRTIIFFFIFLILFYFFSAWVLTITVRILVFAHRTTSIRRVFVLSLKSLVAIFLCALGIAVFHWFFSTVNIINRILTFLKAKPPDKDDTYHQMLQNIVGEVSVATGGRKIDCVVLPIFAMNAFSVADFRNRSVIGVTEGLLARLNRAQLEAVIAHEVAHIVSQDTLIKSVAVSLFAIYAAIIELLKKTMGPASSSSSYYGYERRGRPHPYAVILLIVTSILHGMAKLISMFVSRECEYRADAVATRLVRDPLSLAQALHIINSKWRGGGLGYENMESLFIVNPAYSAIDEHDGFFANVFSTHPPARTRIGVLLDMAHSDLAELKRETKRMKTPRPTEVSTTTLREPRWFIDHAGVWEGPFSMKDVVGLGLLRYDTFVKREGNANVMFVHDDPQLLEALKGKQQRQVTNMCPRCFQALHRALYEGMPLHQCNGCRGVLVEGEKIPRILVRQEQGFSEEVIREAGVIEETAKKPFLTEKMKIKCELPCPRCNGTMLRNFYSFVYPIEVDRCLTCKVIWFDRNELEILQYLIEKRCER